MSLGYEECGEKLTQKNLDLGWKLWKDEQPERGRHIIIADWYDGPMYSLWYIDKEGRYWIEREDEPTEFTDGQLKYDAWIYMPEFNWG